MPGILLFGTFYDTSARVVRLPETPLEDDPRLYDQAVFVVSQGFVEPPHFRRLLRTVSVHLVLLASPLVDFTPLLNLLRFNDRLPPMPADERAFVCAARPYVQVAPNFHMVEPRPIRCSPHQTQTYRRAKDPLRALTMSYPKHQTFNDCLTYARGAFSYVGEKCFANLPKYSPKLQHLVDASRDEAKPRILVYSRFLNGGAIPAALALEEAGFRRHGRPSLLRSDPGNGLHYAFLSKDEKLSNNADDVAAFLAGHIHVVVVAALFLPFNVSQVHFLDAPPLADIQRVLALCPNVQVFFYTSLIDLDEEAADAALYRTAFETLEPLARRILPQILPGLPHAAPVTPAEILRERFLQRLWHPRDDLLQHAASADLAAFVRTYFKNRFGHFGYVARFDDYYVFQPAGALETEFLQTLAGETPWGAAAAPFLQGVEEKTRERVVAAHVADVHNLTRPPILTPFDALVAAHFDALTAVADVAAWVGPHGLSLWRKRGKWVPERLAPYLRTLNPDANLHTAPCELEIRLRLEGRAFLRESDFF